MTNGTSARAPDLSRIAYLTGEYPALSHTFILREVEALRGLGADVLTCSIRRTDPARHHRGKAERAAANTTFYVLPATANPVRLATATFAALKSPKSFLDALALAWKTRPPGLKAVLWQMFYFAEALVLAQHLKSEGARHLHNHFADSSANVAMLTSAISGIPFSFTVHGPAEFFEAHRWAIGTKVARARLSVCISHFARSQVMFFSDPANWGRIAIVHCGIIPERYDRPSPKRTNGTRLIFVGRLTAIKGVRVLIEAFAAARELHDDLSLTLVGDGDDRSVLEELAAPLGDAVHFAGYLSQDEVADVLATADALVLPSFAEGVPVVLMEAMAAGKPVIATRVAGVPELVEDGKSGLLVPPGDAGSLASAIVRLAENPELRWKMGMTGREKVLKEFDVRTEAAWLLSLFRGNSISIRPEIK